MFDLPDLPQITKLRDPNCRAATPEWFIISSGFNEGRVRLTGWSYTAIASRPVALCPRCFALVSADEYNQADLTWAHEQWHAATDYPIPINLK